MLRSGWHRLLPSVFQTVGPTTANARWLYVSSCILGTTSRLAEWRCCHWRLGRTACTHVVQRLVVKTLVHCHTELERDPISHIKPVHIRMTELSQTAVVFHCASKCDVISIILSWIQYFVSVGMYVVPLKKRITEHSTSVCHQLFYLS